jgi:hypothetical protein
MIKLGLSSLQIIDDLIGEERFKLLDSITTLLQEPPKYVERV